MVTWIVLLPVGQAGGGMAGNIPGANDELRDSLSVNSGENANSGGLVSFCYIVGIKRMHRSCYQPYSLNHFEKSYRQGASEGTHVPPAHRLACCFALQKSPLSWSSSSFPPLPFHRLQTGDAIKGVTPGWA